MNIRKFVVFDGGFNPTKEFNEFLESIGYSGDAISSNITDMNFDSRIVEYINDHRDGTLMWNKQCYPFIKGRLTLERLVGYTGRAIIAEVDTDRLWRLRVTNYIPMITYVSVNTNKYGFTSLREEGKR